MMYEMQFRSRRRNLSALTNCAYGSTSSLEGNDNATIIFDDCKNCLFLNPAAEKILGDRSNLCLLEDWIKSLTDDVLQQVQYFQPDEIPLSISLIEEEELKDLEISLTKIEVSIDFWQKLANQLSNEREQQRRRQDNRQRSLPQISDRIIENQLLHSTLYDRLTGLPNYNLLLKNIEKAIAFTIEQPEYVFVVLFLDINRFKIINSSLGRIFGDRLLIEISQRLQRCLRSHDLIARLGSDEFAILLKDIDSVNYAKSVAERIYKELIVPFNLNGYEVFVEASIGIAIGSKDYAEPENLLRDAELAMSDAKRHSKSHYQVFNQSMHGRAVTRLQLENDLRKAIKRREFILHYQPIVSLGDNKIRGFEVLVRWRHSLKGLISPAEFIPVAEETGLIIPLGSWVLWEACRQLRAWQLKFEDISHWKVSVNISSKQLAQPNFTDIVKGILADTQLDPHCLKLEITESSLVEDTSSTIITLKELKALGIEFSLDDFGTGYSSLSYLHQFPFDTIKIDRSFVNSIDSNSEKLGIIRAIITLARNLGMDTIAEGIETVHQLAQLKALKCQQGQGYFLYKPLDKTILETSIAAEIANTENTLSDNSRFLMEEQLAKEQLLFQIEYLRQQLEDLKQEKADLEIMLDTTTEHADLVESQLQNEISDRQKAEAALHQANQELEKLSVLDSLTQVANRRRFDDYLLQEWQRLKQKQAPISLILCDVDYFKVYNDTYGHPIGDYCLQQVALAIECAVESSSGLVARYGGEEFGVILSGIDGEAALKIAEDIASSVNRLKIAHQKSPIDRYVTISLGVFSVIPNSNCSPELLIALADKALYEAKAQGRNQAKLYTG